MLIGVLFLGNLMIGKVAAFVGEPDRLWGLTILTRPVETALSASPWEMFGPFPHPPAFVTHSAGPADFSARFGMLFLIAAGAFVLLRKVRRQMSADGEGRREEYWLLSFLAFFVLAFLLGLFAYDFMVGHIRNPLSYWVRSRLLEPWFYGIFFLGLVLLRRLFRGTGGTVVFVFFGLYLIKTMLVYPGIAVQQWSLNVRFFFKEILSWSV